MYDLETGIAFYECCACGALISEGAETLDSIFGLCCSMQCARSVDVMIDEATRPEVIATHAYGEDLPYSHKDEPPF